MLQDYIEQLGSIVEFMPSFMKKEYQHIYVEYLLLLETHDTTRVQRILRNGILSRLCWYENLPATTALFEDYIDSLISGLNETKKILSNSTDQLREKLKKHYDTKAMDAFLRSLQAHRKVRAALDLPAKQAIKQFQEAAQLLLTSLKINDFDYIAHFQLGWLYLWVLNKPDKAIQCFDRATIHSSKNDEYFHAFAARHLAFAFFCNQNYLQALRVIQETREFTEYEHVLVEYEHLVYALYANKPELVVENLEALANDHSLYYLMIQSEPLFQRYGILKPLLEVIRKNKIQAIQKQFDKRWENSNMRLIQMEEGCNVNRVYLRTLKACMPVLDNVDFIDLDYKARELGDKIFEKTRSGIKAEIQKRHTMYTEQIKAKRKKYAWLNSIGKFIFTTSLYIIIALLILGFYLVLDRYFIPGDSGITVNDWMIALSIMIFALIIGFIFATFETKQVQKLYVKQKLVDDAIDKLHKDTRKSHS